MSSVASFAPSHVSQPVMGAHAGFVSRLIAFVIDLFVLAVAIAASLWFLETLEDLLRPWANIAVPNALIAAAPLIVALYFVGLWRLSGQTIGKWLLGLRVVSTDGGPVSLGRALARLGGYLVSALPLYAGYLWVLVDPERRALHDRLARTVVVYVRRR